MKLLNLLNFPPNSLKCFYLENLLNSILRPKIYSHVFLNSFSYTQPLALINQILTKLTVLDLPLHEIKTESIASEINVSNVRREIM